MKHAKKLLAVVMVFAMVAAFSAIAFAAPAVTFTVGDYADGQATVSAKFAGAVGLTSGSLSFAYADGSVTKIQKKTGADAKAIGDVDNAFSSEFNSAANPAEFGFYFKNSLWSSEEWAAAEGADEEVNGENFEFATFTFTAAAGTVITVTGELKIGDAVTPVNTSFTIGQGEQPTEKPTEKPTEAPTAKPTEKPTEAPTAKPTEKPTETPTAKPTVKPTEAPTKTPVTPVDGAKYDKFGNKILGYDKNGQAIIGYTDSHQPIYSQDKAAHKGVILDIDPNNTGKDFVGGKTDGKKADDKCDTAKAGKTSANVKTDGGKNTGDNSVLAIVAGVVALAGAAFVVTKKRK